LSTATFGPAFGCSFFFGGMLRQRRRNDSCRRREFANGSKDMSLHFKVDRLSFLSIVLAAERNLPKGHSHHDSGRSPGPMSDENRSGTPPMAIVKSEEWTDPNQSSAVSVKASSLQASSASTTRLAGNATANIKNPLLAAPSEPDLELPPRLKAIYDNALRTRPELVERRYAEFLHVEQRKDSRLPQDADHVKL
jgi:hypothetical protein